MVILTGTRVYSTGEKPENPIVRDVVFLISDVREEPVMQTSEEQEPVPHWSYVIDEIIPFGEYLKRVTAEHENEIAEIDGAIFELAVLVTGGM